MSLFSSYSVLFFLFVLFLCWLRYLFVSRRFVELAAPRRRCRVDCRLSGIVCCDRLGYSAARIALSSVGLKRTIRRERGDSFDSSAGRAKLAVRTVTVLEDARRA